jgi:hypothetical protein
MEPQDKLRSRLQPDGVGLTGLTGRVRMVPTAAQPSRFKVPLGDLELPSVLWPFPAPPLLHQLAQHHACLSLGAVPVLGGLAPQPQVQPSTSDAYAAALGPQPLAPASLNRPQCWNRHLVRDLTTESYVKSKNTTDIPVQQVDGGADLSVLTSRGKVAWCAQAYTKHLIKELPTRLQVNWVCQPCFSPTSQGGLGPNTSSWNQ